MSTHEDKAASDREIPGESPLQIVGVGASAGGLEALEAFVGALVPSPDTAFVIAQHLAPSRPTLLVDLLGRCSALPVVEAVDGSTIRGGVIAVAPPSCDVFLDGHTLRVGAAPKRFGPSPSIDRLFESLAESWRERSVAVVLSGTGSDGALGLRAVRAAGGLGLVQSLETAQFDGMPRSAIALGGAELIADADVLGARVSSLAKHVGGPESREGVEPESQIEAILTRLKSTVGIDFDRYKGTTVNRQLQRRMAIREVHGLSEYLDLLNEDADECRALADSLLVSVTSFFRDHASFDALSGHIRDYVASVRPDALRVWVPGCATGEEAYSLAMLVGEAIDFPADLVRRLKVFGTDLDETSLAIARRATYPAQELDDIPEELRPRYTRQTPDGFRIAEVLRECTVFAQQDVGHDPPFPQVDIVSCRNTLIYFNESLQRDVIALFAFALKPGGLLFLGKAESVPSMTPAFEAVDPERRIFRRTTTEVLPSIHAPRGSTRPKSPRGLRAVSAALDADDGPAEQVALLEAILHAGGQSYLVLDPDERLVHVVGDVSRFCQVPQGHLTASAGAFLRTELQGEARALTLLARAGSGLVQGQLIHLSDGSVVQMSALPVPLGGISFTVLGLSLVDGDDVTEGVVSHDRAPEFDRELQRLDRELQASQEVLRRSLTELQAANQELEATSEELQSSLEELQSANEELQASNEELEATNEELSTVNQEQRARGDELERVNLDLLNIQSSVSQGMVIVDRDLRVTRFTPMAVRVFALTPADVGRPLVDVPTSLPTPHLAEPLRRVMESRTSEAVEVASSSGHYLLQFMPYLDRGDACVGVIVTLTDVSQLVSLRDEAEDALSQLQEKTRLLTRQATVDGVTDVSNRSYFTEALEREIDRCHRSGERLALAWIDLDRFKEINDGLGHSAGDVTLRVLADRLRRLVRGTDLVGRLGGDEFGVILGRQESMDELDGVLERIVTAFRDPVPLPDAEARVTASVGTAIYPDDALTAEALLRSADAAMYAVKAHGGDNYAYFDRSMNQEADERRAMRQRIDRGIAENEFLLHYQPIISTVDGSVWGVEALLRWDDRGQLRAADDFISFAESSGQIRRLGNVTMVEARRGMATLAAAGYADLLIALNVSVAQLEDDTLIGQVIAWPTPHGLSGLVIEVVESIFLPDRRHALASLGLLASLGAKTSVDDFGAGYSNYRLLESLAPDYIKLDRSFLRAARDDDSRHVLMESAVRTAHVVDARVVVEGVEAEADLALAQAVGADYAQGYFIAKPMPLNEVIAWLDERRLRA